VLPEEESVYTVYTPAAAAHEGAVSREYALNN
jgi:hypothetical protein